MAIRFERIEELALVTLDRPEALNALNGSVLREFALALDEVEKGDARALLITGAGTKAFCAGADIKELLGRGQSAARAASRFGQGLLSRLEGLKVPSIALINGYAMGGGLELALACTLRIAVKGARLGLPEIKLGLIPGYGGTQRLPRLVGQARALEMILGGRAVEAEEALAMGLVNRLCEGDLLAAGIAFAREMTGLSLHALALAREAVQRGLEGSLEEGLKLEADLNALAFASEDGIEGLKAFLEKRKPTFRDA